MYNKVLCYTTVRKRTVSVRKRTLFKMLKIIMYCILTKYIFGTKFDIVYERK